MGVGLPHRVAVLLANTLADFTGTEPELVVEEATGSMETELPSVINRATVGHPGANPTGWGSARINSAHVTELRAVTCESLALTDLDLWADSENSDCSTDSRVSSDIAASDTGHARLSRVLRKSTKAVKSMRVEAILGMFRRRPDAKRGKNGCAIGMIWQSATILSFALSDGPTRWLTSVISGNLRMYSVVNGLLVFRNIEMSKRTGCHNHGPERTFGYIPPIGCRNKPFKR